MVIGISGKKQSGKDTIAKIINYLISTKEIEHSITYEKWLITDSKYFEKDKEFEIKKFADKLKDIVCLLTGCTRENLESEEFKETYLDESWNTYKVLFSSTTSPILNNTTSIAFNTIEEAKKCAESCSTCDYTIDTIKLTYRSLLQKLGTECGRSINSNIWINSLFSEYRPLDLENRVSLGNVIDYSTCKFPDWIITDVRFLNEAEEIKKRESILIRVNRENISELDSHISETALDNYKNFDYEINNNNSIEKLIDKIKFILQVENII